MVSLEYRVPVVSCLFSILWSWECLKSRGCVLEGTECQEEEEKQVNVILSRRSTYTLHNL